MDYCYKNVDDMVGYKETVCREWFGLGSLKAIFM